MRIILYELNAPLEVLRVEPISFKCGREDIVSGRDRRQWDRIAVPDRVLDLVGISHSNLGAWLRYNGDPIERDLFERECSVRLNSNAEANVM